MEVLIRVSASDAKLIFSLVRKEAKELGYNSQYHDEVGYPGGPHQWPTKLKSLRRIAHKIHRALGHEA